MNWLIGAIAVGALWIATRPYKPRNGLGGVLAGARLGSLEDGTEDCPAATVDLALNTRNRDAAIRAPHVRYGPLNIKDQSYWRMVAEHWGTTPAVAKKSRCANCAAFDLSPRMMECMPGAVQSPSVTLGYCHLHHFKCASNRTCLTWVAGGPIKSDRVSLEWQAKGHA